MNTKEIKKFENNAGLYLKLKRKMDKLTSKWLRNKLK